MRINVRTLDLLLATALVMGVPLHVAAIELAPGLELRGYGHATLQRDAISAASAPEVEYDISLLGTLALGERSRVWLQVSHLSETRQARVDWAFFNWEATPQTTFRVGQARLPLGLHNETRDIQALRASASLPLLYEGDEGSLNEAMRGVVVDHRFDVDQLGSLGVEAFAAWAVVPDTQRAEHGKVAGGRLSWDTPWPGLTLKVSGYAGRLEDVEAGVVARQHEDVLVASAQYADGLWSMAAEAARGRADTHRYTIGYAQVDRQLAPQWRAFLRAEALREVLAGSVDQNSRRLRRLAIGAAWNADDHWGLRIEAARNSGRPEEAPDGVDAGTVRPRWNDVRASVNYIF